MVDTVSPEVRSRIMARVKSKGMKPEMKVRRLLHGLGYRYRLHRSDLPGRPDLVFPSRQKVIFVNGCFWHYHTGCERVRIPSTNQDYWVAKLERNRDRDKRNLLLLEEIGWSALTTWECELRDMETATGRLVEFLEG
jgi:DNA mismatch endonuclease (patch repair protein)